MCPGVFGVVCIHPTPRYHQVHNVTDCVSINHNWFNAANARVCWAMLRDEMREVKKGLVDVEDRCDGVLCQTLLSRKAGADFPTFADILVRKILYGKEGTSRMNEFLGAVLLYTTRLVPCFLLLV